METYYKENVDILIPVVGRSGAGKSSFINRVLEHVYKGDLKQKDRMKTHIGDLNPCTIAVRTAALQPDSKGRRVVLVDTPGLEFPSGNKNKGAKNPFETIATWFRDVDETKSVLAGIIYLHDISRDRVAEDAEILRVLKGLCGSHALTKIVIGTTKWFKEKNRPGEQATLETKISDLKALFQKQLPGTILWKEDCDKCGEKIIDDILNKFSTNFETVKLQIQIEMVGDKKSFSKTNAGLIYQATISQRTNTNVNTVSYIFQKCLRFFSLSGPGP